ncbi:hypothetical protein GDO78_016615 [Eleutherodactylus coqui]|uniref:Uncharacterized protein n=1 Tax=Eleutherodactylus coqui TaxID=57060 RepID=A0A8J6EKE9_ELECQ|nr:hypothetical protein GDO78_016615 [Eleutherodactylus coqui]
MFIYVVKLQSLGNRYAVAIHMVNDPTSSYLGVQVTHCVVFTNQAFLECFIERQRLFFVVIAQRCTTCNDQLLLILGSDNSFLYRYLYR